MAHHQGVQRVLIITLILNLLVAASKIALGLLTGALAILADGFHSLSDAAGNVAALIANRIASQPPDEDHPYGHGRFETVGALGVGVLLLLTAWEVMRGAVGRLLGDAPVIEVVPLMLVVLAGTLGVNLGVSTYQRWAAHRYGSELLLADARNTQADVYVTLSVLASTLLVWAGVSWIDTVIALGVAGLIFRVAVGILWQTGGVLVDTAPFPPQALHGCVGCVPQVLDVRRVRSRGKLSAAHVDVDVLVSPDMTTAQTADITQDIRNQVAAQVRQWGGQVAEIEVHFAPRQ